MISQQGKLLKKLQPKVPKTKNIIFKFKIVSSVHAVDVSAGSTGPCMQQWPVQAVQTIAGSTFQCRQYIPVQAVHSSAGSTG